MRLLTFVLAFILSGQSFAASNLKDVMDEHQFFLTVEWDQKDRAALEVQNEILLQNLSKVPAAEIQAFLNSTFTKEELQYIDSQVKNASREELSELILKLSQEKQMKGTSWNPVTITLASIAAITVAVGGLYVWYVYRELECHGFFECSGGE